MQITKDAIKLLTSYDASNLSEADFTTLANIALSRLQGMLCSPELTLDDLPAELAPVLADLFVWTATNNPQSDGIESETAENYSYSKSSDAEANYLVRLRVKYADILNGANNKCAYKDGDIVSGGHNPLWTPDYYRENRSA